MANPSVDVALVPKVVDHEKFGHAVIRWALMKPELRPGTVGALKAALGEHGAVLEIPPHIGDDHRVEMAQGSPSTLVINLPPLHKLLPMLDFLGQGWSDYVTADVLGFDPDDPPRVPSVSSEGRFYELPVFFFEFVHEADKGKWSEIDYVSFFLNRVGDYCYNGCR